MAEKNGRVPLGALIHMLNTTVTRLEKAEDQVARMSARRDELRAAIAAEREAVANELAAADAEIAEIGG